MDLGAAALGRGRTAASGFRGAGCALGPAGGAGPLARGLLAAGLTVPGPVPGLVSVGRGGRGVAQAGCPRADVEQADDDQRHSRGSGRPADVQPTVLAEVPQTRGDHTDQGHQAVEHQQDTCLARMPQAEHRQRHAEHDRADGHHRADVRRRQDRLDHGIRAQQPHRPGERPQARAGRCSASMTSSVSGTRISATSTTAAQAPGSSMISPTVNGMANTANTVIRVNAPRLRKADIVLTLLSDPAWEGAGGGPTEANVPVRSHAVGRRLAPGAGSRGARQDGPVPHTVL